MRKRLDTYWADHLSGELDRFIREGSHHIVLDLSELEYISSVSVGVLPEYNKMLSEMNGFFPLPKFQNRLKRCWR